jgi:hypothetical protein
MKRRILILASLMAVTFGLVACGNQEALNVDDEEVREEVKEEHAAEKTEVVDPDEDVKIEVIENALAHSEEYNERYEADERVGASYKKSGDNEVSEFEDWKEAYETIIGDVGDEPDYEPGYALIYVNDDEIPELAYTASEGNIVIATYNDGYVNLFSSQIDSMNYIKNGNDLLASEYVETNYNDYVVAIKDGFWIEIAYGTRGPLDAWAEDSFDENGKPIISYWEINGEELSSQDEYDELMAKYYNSSLSEEVKFKGADDIIEEIDAL